MQLEKVTLTYVDEEDRIRLSAQTPEGEVVVLWLTQRLGNRLIPVLRDWLLKQVQGGVNSDVLHQFEQQAAQQANASEQAVVVPPNSHFWLINRVDVSYSSTLMTLIFKGKEEDQTAKMTLVNTAMRQWFDILYRVYQRAQWQCADWPLWMHQLSNEPSVKVVH
ncbi:MAG: hypothetical protein IE928_04065 [Gammaproteobacteria bacterium]|nr:hypothetical protein [Gammaproteobacteria bacterium]